jgi:hypothetical protein
VLAALRPRGWLVIDDTHIGNNAAETAREKVETLRQFVRKHPELTSVELDWATGVIVASRSDA